MCMVMTCWALTSQDANVLGDNVLGGDVQVITCLAVILRMLTCWAIMCLVTTCWALTWFVVVLRTDVLGDNVLGDYMLGDNVLWQ